MHTDSIARWYTLFIYSLQHRHIHPILKIEVTDDDHHILTVQPFRKKGSLRDILNKVLASHFF